VLLFEFYLQPWSNLLAGINQQFN